MKLRSLPLLFFVLLGFAFEAGAHADIFVSINGNQLQLDGGHNPATIYNMMPRPFGQRFGGHYTLDPQVRALNPNDYFSLAVYSDGQREADPANHPKTGADIWVEIASVNGPPGSRFGFWEGLNPNDPAHANWSFNHTIPTNSLAANQPTGGFRFQLSEPLLNQGIAPQDQDPYGHIHGRGFTVDKPGDYSVSFRLYDQSAIHQDGSGPHAGSVAYVFRFRAGPDFQPVCQFTPGTGAVLTWPSRMGIGVAETGITFSVKRSFTLAIGSWVPVGSVTATTAASATFLDATVSGQTPVFYRLEYQWAPP